MWDCIKCGTRAIAHSLGLCPACRTPKGDAMPKTTAGGGGTNAWEPDDPAQDVPDTPEVSEAPEAVSEPSAAETEPPAPKPVPKPPAPPPVVTVTPLAQPGSVTGPGKED